MKLLVVGNPGSGTLSMTNMLRSAGYDVKHEKLGPDGTVSCFFFLKAKYYPREKTTAKRHLRDDFDKFKPYRIIHLVRHPLYCIPSMAKVCGIGHRKWLHDHGIVNKNISPKLLWAAYAWIETNLFIETCMINEGMCTPDYRIQIEQVLKQWPDSLNRPSKILRQRKSSGTRKSEKITWAKLQACLKGDEGLFYDIRLMATRYGYR